MTSHGEKESSVVVAPPKRAWQRMLSGRRLDLLDPRADDIEISDIAHGLARVARWNGQTTGEHAFSVAQHALLVEAIVAERKGGASRELLLAALLHDAPEYVVGDLISPFKAALGLDYKTFENRLLAAVHRRFGLPEILPSDWTAEIKNADSTAAYWEATLHAGFSIGEARIYFGSPDADSASAPGVAECAWPTGEAQRAFLTRFASLSRG